LSFVFGSRDNAVSGKRLDEAVGERILGSRIYIPFIVSIATTRHEKKASSFILTAHQEDPQLRASTDQLLRTQANSIQSHCNPT
jgi:hypothetical protein